MAVGKVWFISFAQVPCNTVLNDSIHHATIDTALVLAFTNILGDPWPLISTPPNEQTIRLYLPVAKVTLQYLRRQQRSKRDPTRFGTCRVQLYPLVQHYEELAIVDIYELRDDRPGDSNRITSNYRPFELVSFTGIRSQLVGLECAIGRRPGLGVELALVSSRPCPGQGSKGKTRQREHRAQSAVDNGEPLGAIVDDGEADLRAGVCCVHRGEGRCMLRKWVLV
jgi:hypothetical protein